jgi:hypothetical protein
MAATGPTMAAPWWSRLLSQRWCGGDPVQVRAESPSRISPIDDGGGTAVDDHRGEEVRRQALFREVNEQIEKLSDGWELFDGSISVLCECGRAGCNEALEVSRTLYDDVRAAPSRFILKVGHELDDVDAVIARHDGYVVAERNAEAHS